MEVVEAAAAQLETLKFSVTGCGVGQGQAVLSPGSVPVPEPSPPPLPSDGGSPDTGQAADAPLAKEQPPELVLGAAVGESPVPPPGPEPPPGGNCVSGSGAAELARTPGNVEDSGSDSESDRSGACGSRSCGERACVAGAGSRSPGGERAPAGAREGGEAPGARCARVDS